MRCVLATGNLRSLVLRRVNDNDDNDIITRKIPGHWDPRLRIPLRGGRQTLILRLSSLHLELALQARHADLRLALGLVLPNRASDPILALKLQDEDLTISLQSPSWSWGTSSFLLLRVDNDARQLEPVYGKYACAQPALYALRVCIMKEPRLRFPFPSLQLLMIPSISQKMARLTQP